MYNFLVFYLSFVAVFCSAPEPISYRVQLEKGSQFLEGLEEKLTAPGVELVLGRELELTTPRWSEMSDLGDQFHLESSRQLPVLLEDEDFQEEKQDRRSDGSPNASNAGLGTGFDGASMPATECSPIGRARDAMSIPDTCSDFDQRDFAGLLEEEIPSATGSSSSSSQPQVFAQQQAFPQQQYQQRWPYPQQVGSWSYEGEVWGDGQEKSWSYPTGVPMLVAVPVVLQQNPMRNYYPQPLQQAPFLAQYPPQQAQPQTVRLYENLFQPSSPQQPGLPLARFDAQQGPMPAPDKDDFGDSCYCPSRFGQREDLEAMSEHVDEGNRDESFLEENRGIIFRFAKGDKNPVPQKDAALLQVPDREGYFVYILKRTDSSLIRADYFYVLKRNGDKVTVWRFWLPFEVEGMHVGGSALFFFNGDRKTAINTGDIYSIIEGIPFKKRKASGSNKPPEYEGTTDGFTIALPPYPNGWKLMSGRGQRE